MVIRQNVQRGVPTRPILFVSVVLAVIALALSAGSALKSTTAPAHVVSAPSVTTVMSPDAQERNRQILQSRGAQTMSPDAQERNQKISRGSQNAKPIYHFE